MDIKLFATVFVTVFLAELGDKTQLATLLFAADQQQSLWIIFIAACAALIVSTAIGVLAGHGLSQVVSARHLGIVAGIGFISVGLWTLVNALYGTSISS